MTKKYIKKIKITVRKIFSPMCFDFIFKIKLSVVGNKNFFSKQPEYLFIKNMFIQLKTLLSRFVKQKTPTFLLRFYVVWAGVEPATHGFSVHCSTN